MNVIQGVALALVALGGLAVVVTRDALRQTMMLTLYGLVLAILFFTFQAPDVALSELVVGAIVIPIILLLTLAKVRARAE